MLGHPEVLIVGGGVIGLTAAYYLAREGVAVEVVDQGDLGREASWAGAGILPPGNPARAATPLGRLLGLGSTLFPALSEELRDRTGIDNGYRTCGGLEFLPDADAIRTWQGEEIRFERLAADAVHRLEPGLAPETGAAYHLPGTAQVRNPRHLKALAAGCQRLGVHLRPSCRVHGLERRQKGGAAVLTPAGRLEAERVVLAAGAWSDPLLQAVGWRPGIRPMRGQIALLNPGPPLIGRVIIEGRHYLVPRLEGRVLVGSTDEDVGFDKRTTAEAVADLLSFAGRMAPGLAKANVEQCWAGLRPGSPDGMPFLGCVPGCENCFVAAGHGRAGIQLSPATALVLSELVLGKTTSVPLESFRLDRSPVAQPAVIESSGS